MLTVCWSWAWRITWWGGEKLIFYSYSSPLRLHEKAKKEVESSRLGTHSVPLVVLWVCSDESVLHLTQRKEVGWRCALQIYQCWHLNNSISGTQVFDFVFVNEPIAGRFRKNGPQLLCRDRVSLSACNLTPPYVQCMSPSHDTSSSQWAKLTSGER